MTERTVMVCEDEYLIRMDISERLREAGYRVVEAKDAECAQSLFLSGEHVDLLSTDVMLPGRLDGLELAHWVRSTHPEVRILIMTGWAKDHEDAREYDDFMRKPCDLNEFVGRVRAIVPPNTNAAR
jgi:DNA-binding response OmpR family regulator